VCLWSELVSIVVIVELASMLDPGHRVIVLVPHHAHIHGVKVLDEVFKRHPEHAVVALYKALDLGLCIGNQDRRKE